MSNTFKKITAVFLTLTSPIWIGPFLICIAVTFLAACIYDDMRNLIGVKNDTP